MRWTSYYLINLNVADRRTRDVAEQWREKYGISPDRVFAPQGQLWPPAPPDASHGPYSPLIRNSSLASLDRGAKLIIVGRGYTTLTVPWATGALGRELHRWGLREVGLIAIENEFADPVRYLHDFAMALNERSIGFGWLVAYQRSGQRLCFRRDSSQADRQPAAVLRGNILTPEADKWYFPKYAPR